MVMVRADSGLLARPPPGTLAARRAQAALWAAVTAGLITIYSCLAYALARSVGPAVTQRGLVVPPPGASGLGLRELGYIFGLAAAMTAAITSAQDWMLRPLMGPRRTGEKVFFFSSLATRAAFAAVLLRHHYAAPAPKILAPEGDLGHRYILMALFYASYTTDLLQLRRRPQVGFIDCSVLHKGHSLLPAGVGPNIVNITFETTFKPSSPPCIIINPCPQEFTPNFCSFMALHHGLSFAWFTPWMALLAPRGGPEGAAIWNTVFVYLCAAVPNHFYKLVQGCLPTAPPWYGWLMGPAVCCHWLVLLGSQKYYFQQCGRGPWGCWTPGTLMMLAGAWGMAVWDVPQFLDAIVANNSKLLGTRIGFWDIGPLLLRGGRGPEPEVTAEIVLRSASTAKGAAAPGPTGGPAARAAAPPAPAAGRAVFLGGARQRRRQSFSTTTRLARAPPTSCRATASKCSCCRRQASELLQSTAFADAGVAKLQLGQGQAPVGVDELMGALRQVLVSSSESGSGAHASPKSDSTSDLSMRPCTPDALGAAAAAAGLPPPPPPPPAGAPEGAGSATRVVQLQSGNVTTACVGVAPGERNRRLADKAAKQAAGGLQDLDPGLYCREVTLQCGGPQTTSYGLAPGERKGDFARARFMAADPSHFSIPWPRSA
ncbi:MAG: hypothetical protein J3K34DRAFT_455667 [Monoraphidium minutum]|nr:MAG: hypothetical protein J3K34DRAFT_455667 [Monoraphidium minutum]